MSDGDIGYGTTLAYGESAGAEDNLVGEIYDINLPPITRAKVDFTNNDSPDETEELKPGLLQLGDVTFNMNLTAESYSDLDSLARSTRATCQKAWLITLPDGSTQPFTGFVCGLTGAVPTKDRMTCAVTICVQTKGDLTASS